MKGILITILSILTGVYVFAQISPQAVMVKDIELKNIDDSLSVRFTFFAGEKATKSNYNLVALPILYNKTDSIGLPLIVIQGKKARIAEERYSLATGKTADTYSLLLENGESVAYKATVPFQPWMNGANLTLNGLSVGCCSSSEVSLGDIAEHILIKDETEPVSEEIPFVAPVTTYKGDTSSLDGALTIYFRQGKKMIDYEFKDNQRTLVKLISAIRTIQESNNSRIAHIIIAGFASPEGSIAFNEKLAGDRAIALKQLLLEYTSLRQDQIQIHNGSVDWSGLRELVSESDMFEKHQILNIIDNTPIWDSQQQRGRLNKLMNFNGGEPYQYMLNTFFPLLRNATYVKVYYESL